jgi:hypothetical protein
MHFSALMERVDATSKRQRQDGVQDDAPKEAGEYTRLRDMLPEMAHNPQISKVGLFVCVSACVCV